MKKDTHNISLTINARTIFTIFMITLLISIVWHSVGFIFSLFPVSDEIERKCEFDKKLTMEDDRLNERSVFEKYKDFCESYPTSVPCTNNLLWG